MKDNEEMISVNQFASKLHIRRNVILKIELSQYDSQFSIRFGKIPATE